MVLLIVEKVPRGLRGELSRWMIEPRVGVFVGNLSGIVRDRIWDKVTKTTPKGGAMLVFNAQTEQGFSVCTSGDTSRSVIDAEGLSLVCIPAGDG